MTNEIYRRCCEIADQIVPEYRARNNSCTGHIAKRWQSAWDGACVALGGDPGEIYAQVIAAGKRARVIER